MNDMINHPSHYTQASVMLEPIDVLRYAPFDLGNCLKYVLRAGHKGDELEDWKKAKKYAWWTYESSAENPTPYQEFFKHYVLLLFKFEMFKHYPKCSEYNFNEFIRDLIDIIEHRIERLEVKQ